jgi:hypothetical protein
MIIVGTILCQARNYIGQLPSHIRLPQQLIVLPHNMYVCATLTVFPALEQGQHIMMRQEKTVHPGYSSAQLSMRAFIFEVRTSRRLPRCL